MNRITIALLLASAALNASALEVEKTFTKTCGICHIPGVMMAPKVGNSADWAPRMTNGLEGLVQSVTLGKGGMPAKGLCSDCASDDFRALIKYMLPR